MESIEVLAQKWLDLKAEEKALSDARATIEQAILSMVETKIDGSKTTNTEGYKITVKRPINRTIDLEMWKEVGSMIPSEVWPVKQKTVIDEPGCKWLKENKPELWALAARAITEKEGKANVSIEVKNGD